MRASVIAGCVAWSSPPAAAQPAASPDDAGANLDAMTAEALAAAKQGECDRAMDIVRLVGQLDPPRYRVLASEPVVSACQRSVPPAHSSVAPEVVYGTRGYLEPSAFVLVAFDRRSLDPYEPVPATFLDHPVRFLGRFATGLRIARYAEGGEPSLHIRVGLTAFISPRSREVRALGGVGGELALDLPVSSCVRAGGRIGIEAADKMALLTVGSRVYVGPDVSLAVDLFTFTTQPVGGTGLMFGVGLTDTPATYLTAPLMVLLGIFTVARADP